MSDLHVLIVHEDNRLVAVGLEHGLTASGDSLGQVQDQFTRVLLAQIYLDAKHGITPLSRTPRAPDAVWAAWEHRRAELQPVAPATLPIGDWEPALRQTAREALDHTRFAMV
jgi:hypothetical protein